MGTTSAVQGVLSRAQDLLQRGRGGDAAHLLAPALKAGSLSREDELAIRASLAEAALLQDDLTQAATILGRPPDTLRDPVSDACLSSLWRLHGRITYAKGEQSRAIALHTRALKHAELAHDSRSIGLAHYELALCYKQVGDTGIVREHLTEAAATLHAAGDRRHLALVHSLSAVLLAQSGRGEEANSALLQGERLAVSIQADDVQAVIVHNQANVALMRHQHEQALALAERSVALHESRGSTHGLAVTLATLGQIFVQLGDIDRAEATLTRTLEVKSPVQFHETTGAVFDSLAQIHLMRGDYDKADECLRRASEAYGAYGSHTMRWYEWSLKVIAARLAVRRADFARAVELADELTHTTGVPLAESLQAELAACEALVAAGRTDDAARRVATCEERLDPRTAPLSWGELLRIRGALHDRAGRVAAAHHDLSQSVNVFELVGERYQAALSQLALGALSLRMGATARAAQVLQAARDTFQSLGARRDLAATRDALDALAQAPAPTTAPTLAEADDVVVRRLIDASALSDLLARETCVALVESTDALVAVVFVFAADGEVRVVSHAGSDEAIAHAVATAATREATRFGDGMLTRESLGRGADGPRHCAAVSPARLGEPAVRRLRMFTAIARQGFELCDARERRAHPPDQANERSLEPLLPGFVCASAAMHRVAEQIQRLQGHDLTVLITGESGTGKDLVARAIHAGSLRTAAMFLPYNCTTTQRDLADSQLFGHRRGSFTGAVSDQPGLIRTAAGGTLFLDEIGDLPLDVQPKLLRFLEQGEIMPVGEARPQAVDVRVLAATNADLEQRVAEGKFREDLYYRLAVIRIHVPPLRERLDEIPHLSTFFLREACDRLARPGVHLTTETLDVLTRYWWPGNVRQLRNEIQRAVALSMPGGEITPDQLSPELASGTAGQPASAARASVRSGGRQRLSTAVEALERELIGATLDDTRGNISETARVLGLTRRGLYLKMRRLGLGQGGSDTD